MKACECVAMILAGGQGSRLGALTKRVAKPGVSFGGKYRIIDFVLSNCIHSGIETVGVLTQYQPLVLNTYIGSGLPWDLDRNNGGVYVLPPFVKASKGEWYKGTANAIYQNIPFIEQFDPKYVVVLSGDHIYKMHYGKMLEVHKKNKAAATVAVMPVDWSEASRFGIMNVDENGAITEFEEKPANPNSNLASMGIYIFDWQILKKYLIVDENNPRSENDFGKNVIPQMLAMKEKMYTYSFSGYWRDVGTVQSLWEANMDMLSDNPALNVTDVDWRIYSRSAVKQPHFINHGAVIKNSCITEGCEIYGHVENSVLSDSVIVEPGAIVKDSVIMPGVKIESGAIVEKAILANGVQIGANAKIGLQENDDSEFTSDLCSSGIVLIEEDIIIGEKMEVYKGSMIEQNMLGSECVFDKKTIKNQSKISMAQGGA